MSPFKQRITFILIVLTLTILADQGTKIWARRTLRGEPAIILVDKYLALEYHENPGVAFGLGRGLPWGRYLFIVIGAVVLFLVWRIVRQTGSAHRSADFAFALVAGGAVGNLIDRIFIGRVVDFVVMHWQHRWQWPAYNVADAALVVGMGILLFVLGKQPKSSRSSA